MQANEMKHETTQFVTDFVYFYFNFYKKKRKKKTQLFLEKRKQYKKKN